MDIVLMKEYVYKDVDKYYFVKKVYFDYANERVLFDMLVYSETYQTDIDYLFHYIETSNFDELAEKTIKEFLKEHGINYE